jgi:hypothetical protein
MICKFCQKEYTSKIGFSNHIRRCPSNPNRIIETLTDEGRAKIVSKNLAYRHSEETKKKLSESMKKAVLANPESYSSSNRGRTKQIIVDGIKLQGQWEVDFYLWAKSVGLLPERPRIGFRYEWNGLRTYFPDFYIKSLNLYVEVKGYETERDRAKWDQFPEKLIVVKKYEISQIRQGIFNKASLA